MQALSRLKSLKKKNKLTFLMVRASAINHQQGILQAGYHRFRCALGRSGISARKCEGDGATPLAVMRLLSGFQKPTLKKMPRSSLIIRRIHKNDGWCDTPFDANYNRLVHYPYSRSAEQLLRSDHLYDIGLVMDWNISQRKQGAGSAIFMHIARANYQPTEGCIALSPRDMQRLLPFLMRQTKVIVKRS